MTTNIQGKYRSKAVWYDLRTKSLCNEVPDKKDRVKKGRYQFFASWLEYQTYQRLIAHFGEKRVTCQFPIPLYPKRDKLPALSYIADFAIFGNKDEMKLLVEVKGYTTKDFKVKLKILSEVYPWLFEKLLFVTKGYISLPVKKVTIDELSNYLENNGDL